MGKLNRVILIFLIIILFGSVMSAISSAYLDTDGDSLNDHGEVYDHDTDPNDPDTNNDGLDTRYRQQQDYYADYYEDHYYMQHYYIRHAFITGFIILWILWSLRREVDVS